MAAVFLCEDERLGRQVAVKRLHADSAEEMAQRFAREARLGALLNHPNLVSVFDTVTVDEGVLIVMEYVEGETLRDAVKRGPLGPDRALRVIRDLASALDHAHSHGVVHRDVKPANVLLRKDSVTKLVDLGIATAAHSTRITTSGTVLGTAAYMAPEQLEGREAGPPADVYALATVAFEALCGCRPREGRTPMEIAHRLATEPPPDLTQAWSGAPPAAAEALRRGMATDPAARQASAGALAAELESALREEARAEPPTAPTRPVAQPEETAPKPPVLRPTPAPRRRHVPPPRPRERDRRLPVLLALLLVGLAAGAALVAALSGSGGEDRSADRDRPSQQAAPQRGGQGAGQQGGAAAPGEQPAQGQEQSQPQGQAEPAQGGGVPEPSGSDPAEGARLNSQGYRLTQQGRYDEAVPVLRRAVEAFPPGTDDIRYAYALYNLGRALRLAGRPGEAIPVLERRLQIPNQTGAVQRELEAARRAAG